MIGDAGVPREEQLFAVFDDESEAHAAEEALSLLGVEVQRLRPAIEGRALAGEDAPQGLLGKLERLAKRIGGESHEAERYASHLASGRTVLALHASDRDMAMRFADLLVSHGGYDVTYYHGWGTEYMSTEANHAHGLPSHTNTNVEE